MSVNCLPAGWVWTFGIGRPLGRVLCSLGVLLCLDSLPLYCAPPSYRKDQLVWSSIPYHRKVI